MMCLLTIEDLTKAILTIVLTSNYTWAITKNLRIKTCNISSALITTNPFSILEITNTTQHFRMEASIYSIMLPMVNVSKKLTMQI